jgi:hypothetical protein
VDLLTRDADATDDARVCAVRVVIRGHHLPGRHVSAAGEKHDNVHVAVQERADPVSLVPADAPTATWEVDIRVVPGDDGALDFRGPVVHGKRGDRFVYLTWGNVTPDGSFRMFRRAKLMLNRIDPSLVRVAEDDGRTLLAVIHLTDDCGGPRCARVDPPALEWSVEL